MEDLINTSRLSLSLENTILDLEIGDDGINRLSSHLLRLASLPHNIVFLYDEKIDAHLFDLLEKELIVTGFTIKYCKVLSTYSDISASYEVFDFLAENNITKDDILFAAGTSHTLSLANYVSSSWYGSMKLVGFCCDLLSLIEGVCLPAPLTCKNKKAISLKSNFKLCVVDTNYLRKLSDDQRHLLYAYELKYGLIASKESTQKVSSYAKHVGDASLYDDIQQVLNTLKDISSVLSSDCVADLLAMSFADEVSQALLELSSKLDKGSAISLAIRFLSRVSAQRELCDIELVRKIDEILDDFGLIDIPVEIDADLLFTKIKEARFEKYNRFVLALIYKQGRVRLSLVDDECLKEHCDAWCIYHKRLLNS